MRGGLIAATVFVWTTLVLCADGGSVLDGVLGGVLDGVLGDGGLATQRLFGLATWALLLGFLAGESALVRAQVGVVVAFATAVEYTFSPLLGVYTYRLDNVPAYVPPGHGLVYLCALALGRTAWVHRHHRRLRAGVVLAGGAFAGWGLFLAEQTDVLGAFWYLCLVGFCWFGRSQTLYLGAFAIVTYLELVGTWAETWTWSTHDPTGLIPIGNPPSGAAGGYGWFDLAALWSAPFVLAYVRWARTALWRRPLVATALPPSGPGRPETSVNVPPASDTISASGARSCSATSGSAARSTVPSASST